MSPLVVTSSLFLLPEGSEDRRRHQCTVFSLSPLPLLPQTSKCLRAFFFPRPPSVRRNRPSTGSSQAEYKLSPMSPSSPVGLRYLARNSVRYYSSVRRGQAEILRNGHVVLLNMKVCLRTVCIGAVHFPQRALGLLVGDCKDAALSTFWTQDNFRL